LLATTALSAAVLVATGAHAQQVLTATDQASLVAAINTANGQSGDTIRLLNNISVTSALPNITSPLTVDLNSFSLSSTNGGTSTLLNSVASTPPGALTVLNGALSLTSNNAVAINLTQPGTVTNSGAITSSGLGVQLGGTSTVTNNASGSIVGQNGNAIYGVTTASITNNGSLSSGVGTGYDAIYVTNGGSLTNTGTITGDGAAVQFNGPATIANSSTGVITGNTTGSAIYVRGVATLTNAGSLISTNSAAVAILQGGSITNTGSITGTFEGVQLGSSSYPNGGTATNSGTIRATGAGGNGATIVGAGGVINNNAGGLIATTLTAGSGAWGVDFEGANATLNNAGGVQGDVGVVFDGGGTLTNASTGNIAGTTTGVASGAGGTSGAVNLTSAGQISGGTYAIQLTGAFNNVINLQAGSQTTGLISTDSGNDAVTLAGLSSGGVNLGGGNNTLTLVGGANAGGTLDGGTGGTNSLILTGAASGTVSASQFADFATVTKTGTGTWFVNGPSTLGAAWTIQQGTVQITDVTGVGTAVVANNGVLSLYGASGTFTNAVSGTGQVQVTAVPSGSTLTFSGNLTNTGNGQASLLVFDGSHVAIGGVNTAGTIGVQLAGNGATLDVLSGASITSAGYAVYGSGTGVTVNNAGTLVGHSQGNMYGTSVDLYAGGTLNNSGSITGDTIGVELGQTGTVNNAAGGTISGLNGNAIYAVQGATIVNNGTLTSAAGSGYNAIYVTNGGSLANTGTINGDGAAVEFDGSATVTNSASGAMAGNTGSAVYIRGVGTLTNAGTLTSTNSEAVAILQGGSVANTGSITGLYVGVQLGSSSHPLGGAITNSGTIQATTDGGTGVYTAGPATVTNSAGGLIAATLTAGSGSWGLQSDLGALTLTNAGTIRGDVGVVLDAGGTVTNAATGVITGTTTGVNSGAGGASAAVNIINAGLISGGTTAIQLTGAYDNTISLQAGSTTTGLISTDAGNDTLTMAGTSTGGVNLGGGDNTLTLVSGASAGGTLDGGTGGTNALLLTGSTNGSIAGSQLLDFATAAKSGAGTWTLTGGASGLSAAWTVQQGVLSVANDAALGTGSLTINGGAEFQATATTGGTRAVTIAGTGADIDVTSGATYTLGGVVSGASGTSLNVNNGGGSGVLAFTANNSATLASDINLYGGTVYAGVNGALGTGTIHVYDPDLVIASGVTVANKVDLHSTFTVEQDSGTGGISGAITESTAGSGITKVGAGTLSLSGVNTYTGATTISTGTLALTGAGSISSSSVVDNGTLDISGSTTGASIKSLSGSGSVALGATTLTLTNASGTFSGSIQGTGGVTFAGGTETLTGTDTYSGATTVSGGTLVLTGSLTNSSVNVVGGGSVQGSGTVANLVISAGSVLSPGGAAVLGQVAPAGTLTLSAGSIYQVTANAAGQSDLVAAGGKATVTGASVQVQAAAGTYTRNTSYTILTAAGGVNGTFTGATSNFAFLRPTLSYSADAVNLTLTNTGVTFQSLAQTANQASVATALNGSDQNSTLYNAVLVQTDAGARQAFNALSGEMYATAATTELDETHYVRDAVLDRLRQSSDETAIGSGPTVGAMPSGALRLAAWAQVVGAWARGSSQNGGVAPSQASTGGAIVGVDGAIHGWRAGVALAQLETTINLPERASHDSIETTHAAVYAGGPVFGLLKARVGFDYAWNDAQASRQVIFPGLLDQEGAHYHSQSEDAFAELGYGMTFRGLGIEPYANVAYVRLGTDNFSEGDDTAALNVRVGDIDTAMTDLGVRTGLSFQVSPTSALQPYVNVAWRHIYSNVQAVEDATFASNGASFAVRGAALDKDAGHMEAGVSLSSGFGAKLTAAYIGQISSNWQDHQAKLALSWAF
jgi:uncharacterized protein with beta-barrel porin domain